MLTATRFCMHSFGFIALYLQAATYQPFHIGEVWSGYPFSVLTSIVFVMLSCLFIAALWSPEGKGLTSCLWCFLWCCYFPIWCPVTGVVLDCFDSWSLLSFFLPNDTERAYTPLCDDGFFSGNLKRCSLLFNLPQIQPANLLVHKRF